MTEDELKQLTLPVKPHCHVWVWTTHMFMPLAFSLLEQWSLRYVCTFVWHKKGGFQPLNRPQYNCEFALYATYGCPRFTITKAFKTGFKAPRGGHSVKPDFFYATVRRVTEGRRLDLFARRTIEGFEGWGQEYDRGVVDQDDRVAIED